MQKKANKKGFNVYNVWVNTRNFAVGDGQSRIDRI